MIGAVQNFFVFEVVLKKNHFRRIVLRSKEPRDGA